MPSLLADLLDAVHGVVEVAGDLHRQRAVVERLRELAVGDLAGADEDDRLHQLADRSSTAASDALVLPVEAQAARLAPIVWACVKAAVMPLSLKLPEGFIPSYCRYSLPALHADVLGDAVGACCSSVCPSPMVTILFGGANGSSSWNRQTPLKQSGSWRRDHLCFEVLRATAGLAAVPVVSDVEQRAARFATGADLADVVRRRAIGHHAALIGEVGFRLERGCHREVPLGRYSA